MWCKIFEKTESCISKQIDSLNNEKATGHDGASSKPSIKPLTFLISQALSTSVFPDQSKFAEGMYISPQEK